MEAQHDPDQHSLRPTTTSEEDLRTASQRRVNLIWEYTQAGIAIYIVFAAVVYEFAAGYLKPNITPSVIPNAFFLVMGFYFGRTNHARIGDTKKVIDDR